MVRKLASIQKINGFSPIAEADRIEVAHILGWNVVVKKGDFSIGDKCVYFEVDSFLDHTDPRYAFLMNSSYRNNPFMGEGIRIKTISIRGCLSQGLALPLSAFPELKDLDIGTDVTEALGVKKWEVPEIAGSAGTMIGDKPYGIPTTDETRIQSMEELREGLLHKPYYISTKMDGTSCTIYAHDGNIGVCGRDSEIANDGKSMMWDHFNSLGTPDKLREFGQNIVIQGEFCGPKIQGNRLGLNHYDFYVFNIFDKNMKLLPVKEMLELCERLGLKSVPIEEYGDDFAYTTEELLERAHGKYPSGKDKEGIVIRPQNPFWYGPLRKSLSFKVLNNDFLKKEKG